MSPSLIECLRCGRPREADTSPFPHVKPECPACGYLGWAPVGATGDRERRLLRRLVLELVRPTRLA